MSSYANIFNANLVSCFRTVLSKLTDNKIVLFHCNEGCDRTGSFAFVLGAILGMSESDLAKDYELSSLYFYARQRNGTYKAPDYDTTNGYGNYRGMIEYINNTYSGTTINDKVTNALIALGVTQDEISQFKNLMLNP